MGSGAKPSAPQQRGVFLSAAVAILCSVGVAAFLAFYFSAYQSPYTQGEIFDLSAGWQYSAPQTGQAGLANLRRGLAIKSGETLTLQKKLGAGPAQAAVLIRTNKNPPA